MGDNEPRRRRRGGQYASRRRGIYKKLIVRDGQARRRASCSATLGARRRPACSSFDRGTPLPDSARRAALRRRATPKAAVSVADLPDDAQICNCNGVSQGRDRRRDQRRLQAHRLKRSCNATRAGTGCGSCKELVKAADRGRRRRRSKDDPASALVRARRAARQARRWSPRSSERGLKSVSRGVRRARPAARKIQAARPASPRCSRRSGATSTSTSATRASSTTASTPTSRRTAPSPSSRASTAASPPPTNCARIADVAEKYNVPMVKITGGQRIDLLGITKEDLPGVWQDLGMPSRPRLHQGVPHLQDVRRHRVLPLRRRRLAPRSGSRSRSGSRASSRRPR